MAFCNELVVVDSFGFCVGLQISHVSTDGAFLLLADQGISAHLLCNPHSTSIRHSIRLVQGCSVRGHCEKCSHVMTARRHVTGTGSSLLESDAWRVTRMSVTTRGVWHNHAHTAIGKVWHSGTETPGVKFESGHLPVGKQRRQVLILSKTNFGNRYVVLEDQRHWRLEKLYGKIQMKNDCQECAFGKNRK